MTDAKGSEEFVVLNEAGLTESTRSPILIAVSGIHHIKGVAARVAAVVGNPCQAREGPSRTALIGERDGPGRPKGIFIVAAGIRQQIGKLKAIVRWKNNRHYVAVFQDLQMELPRYCLLAGRFAGWFHPAKEGEHQWSPVGYGGAGVLNGRRPGTVVVDRSRVTRTLRDWV